MITSCTSNLVLSWLRIQSPTALKYVKPALFPRTGELIVRYAGHSKWQNIKHTKAANDRRKCQQFQGILAMIHRAMKGGASADPKLNTELGKAVKEARVVNMPMETVNRVIAKLDYVRKNPIPTQYLYRSSNRVLILINAATDNKSRTGGEITKVLKKNGFFKQYGDPAAAFYAKGWIFAKPPPDTADVTDKSLEDAIEVEAEEVAPDEERPELLKFVCESAEMNKVKSKLENRNYTIEEAEVVYIPRGPIELEESEMEQISNIIEELEENVPEVEKCFVNIA